MDKLYLIKIFDNLCFQRGIILILHPKFTNFLCWRIRACRWSQLNIYCTSNLKELRKSEIFILISPESILYLVRITVSPRGRAWEWFWLGLWVLKKFPSHLIIKWCQHSPTLFSDCVNYVLNNKQPISMSWNSGGKKLDTKMASQNTHRHLDFLLCFHLEFKNFLLWTRTACRLRG